MLSLYLHSMQLQTIEYSVNVPAGGPRIVGPSDVGLQPNVWYLVEAMVNSSDTILR